MNVPKPAPMVWRVRGRYRLFVRFQRIWAFPQEERTCS